MKNKICTGVLILLTIVMAITGCSQRSTSVAKDPSTARNLLNQVYSGSLCSVQGELDPSFQRGNPDRVTAGTSSALSKQFGSIRSMKLQSVGKDRMNSAIAIWMVMAERGTYEMKVTFDSKGKVVGLWFRSSPAQEWTPSHILGLDYLKPGTAAQYGSNLMKGR